MTQAHPGSDLDLGRSRGMRWIWVGVAVVVLAGVLWYVTHPPALTSASGGTADTPADDAVYLGVARVSEDGQTAVLRGIEAHSSPGDADVRALICRSGSIGTTQSLATFCAEVDPAVGNTLGSDDQLVLAVTGQQGEIRLDGLAVSYRSGVQYDTQELDYQATVRILSGAEDSPGSS